MKNFIASTPTNRRRGLAPLELVFVLPLLMGIMAVIIVFGYAASWKLRTETAARDSIWRARWERFANDRASAPEWPTNASQSTSGTENLNSLMVDRVVFNPIIAGPIPEVNVNTNRLDLSRSVRDGVAVLNREPPIFARLTSFRFTVEHPILTDRYQIRQMGAGNNSRRMPLIYETALDFIRSSPGLINATLAIVNAPVQDRLVALDRDPEFIEFSLRRTPNFPRAPNFHPRVGGFCISNQGQVRTLLVQRLISQIENLPTTLGRASIGLYRTQLNNLSEPSEIARAELEQKIAAVEGWLSTIGN